LANKSTAQKGFQIRFNLSIVLADGILTSDDQLYRVDRRQIMAKKRGKRFRLLIYERMWQRWAWPCVLIVLASAALWRFAPRISTIHPSLRILAIIPALVCLVILVYAYLARRLAWIQCRSGHLRIQTPIYPLAISYSRIKGARPKTLGQVFDPTAQKAAQRNWLRPYWHKTVLVVELSKYPVSKKWLRLWFSPYLLPPHVTGFVFLVEDWMALSRQLEDYRANWEMHRAAQRQDMQVRRLR